MEELKLYLVDECMYIAAYSEAQAENICENETEVDGCEAIEIPFDEIKEIKIYDIDGVLNEDGEYPLISIYEDFIDAKEKGITGILSEIEC